MINQPKLTNTTIRLLTLRQVYHFYRRLEDVETTQRDMKYQVGELTNDMVSLHEQIEAMHQLVGNLNRRVRTQNVLLLKSINHISPL